MKMTLSTAVLASFVIVGPAFCLNRSAIRQCPAATDSPTSLVRRSIIKVHTGHGVITLPGNADSWTEVEDAVFVADAIADFRFANSAILGGLRISNWLVTPGD